MKIKDISPEDIQGMKAEIAAEHGVHDFKDVDRGELTSRQNGDITRTLVALSEQDLAQKQQSSVPNALKNQNLGHNGKKEGFGPNTKR